MQFVETNDASLHHAMLFSTNKRKENYTHRSETTVTMHPCIPLRCDSYPEKNFVLLGGVSSYTLLFVPVFFSPLFLFLSPFLLDQSALCSISFSSLCLKPSRGKDVPSTENTSLNPYKSPTSLLICLYPVPYKARQLLVYLFLPTSTPADRTGK